MKLRSTRVEKVIEIGMAFRAGLRQRNGASADHDDRHPLVDFVDASYLPHSAATAYSGQKALRNPFSILGLPGSMAGTTFLFRCITGEYGRSRGPKSALMCSNQLSRRCRRLAAKEGWVILWLLWSSAKRGRTGHARAGAHDEARSRAGLDRSGQARRCIPGARCPSIDIGSLRNIELIVRDGTFYDPAGGATLTPILPECNGWDVYVTYRSAID